jgi:hypothetical protein
LNIAAQRGHTEKGRKSVRGHVRAGRTDPEMDGSPKNLAIDAHAITGIAQREKPGVAGGRIAEVKDPGHTSGPGAGTQALRTRIF